MTSPADQPLFDRRNLIRGTSALGLGAVLAESAAARPAGTPDFLRTRALVAEQVGQLLQGTCMLTPSSIEGPFYLDLNHIRQDITQGLPGLPVTLVFQVVDASCNPIESAVVDVWHTDAEGRYSGFAVEGTAGETWLRGAQITGQNGLVFFQTIFPGWYPGRAAHIHVKVFPTENQVLTTQVYFPDFVSAAVYDLLPPYTAEGPADTTNQTDGFYTPSTEMFWGVIPGPLAIWAGTILGVPA